MTDGWYDEKLEYVFDRNEIEKYLPAIKKESYICSVPLDQKDERIKEGWQVFREYKTVVKLEKKKSHDDIFENYFWCLLAEMGFKYLSSDRHKFKLELGPNDNKQIDVFGIDDVVVVIAECKSAEKPNTKGDFRQEIAEISDYQSKIAKKLNMHFSSYKPKYIFFFCTENYEISENDQQRMKESNIIWFEKRKIDYYYELTNQLGPLAKYQFLGEILQGKDIPGLSEIKIPAIKSKMGKYDCYAMMVEPSILLKICFVLHRSENVDMKNTYQRYVKKGRINQIREYIEAGGFFPNSIILNFDSSSLQFEKAPKNFNSNEKCIIGNLLLPAKYRSAFIIDGQHRLYGYAGAKNQENALIPVIAFQKVAPEDQTKMFVDINNKAKAVKRNLLESLNGEIYWNSPNPSYALSALNSMLAIKLTNDHNSPLLGCIQLDEKNKKTGSSITLSYFIDNAVKAEKYFVKEFHKNGSPVTFGPLYDGDLADNSLKKSYEVLSSYFKKIKMKCPVQWEKLLTNIGISTLSQVLSDFFAEFEKKNIGYYTNLSAKDVLSSVQNWIDILCDEIAKKSVEDIERYQRGKLGYGGVRKAKPYFERLVHDIDPSFNPDYLEKWILEQSGEYSDKTKELIFAVEEKIVEITHNKLLDLYGEKYFLKLPPTVLLRVQKREEQAPSRQILIEYEDVKEIVTDNWKDKFEGLLGDKSLQGDKATRTKYLDTIQSVKKKINDEEAISEEEYNSILEIYNWFNSNGLLETHQ